MPITDSIDVDSLPLTAGDLSSALARSFPNNKSSGPSSVPCALLKYLDSAALHHLSNFFRHIAATEIPSDWKLSAVTAVHKKGPPHIASNYRAICIMGPLPKLFMACLNRHITSIADREGWRASL